jgi:hypothetical protein
MLPPHVALALALASTGSNPIVIDDCQVLHTGTYVSAFRPIVLSFTNRGGASADVVRFTVEYGGRKEQITDKGLFAQNVRIDHAFSGFYNVRYAGPPPLCSVDYVEFSDGSAWPVRS